MKEDNGISNKLKIYFLISIPIFIAHGIEEYLTGYYNVGFFFKFAISPLEGMSLNQAIFLTFQIMVLLLLIVSFLLLQNRKVILYLMVVLGLIFVLELHHPITMLILGSYSPGTFTAFLFLIIGFLFWKELINNFKKN